LKKERALFVKKNNLFNDTKDVTKWGWTGSKELLEGRADELLKAREKAFKFMLSEETKLLNE